MNRLKITVNGKVQRVGYRDVVSEIARELGLKGTVKNLEDEVSVEIIAEGEEKQLKKFLELINIKKYPIDVLNIETKEEEATEEFKYFKILRGEGTEEIGERLDLAGKLLYQSLEKQDKMLDKQDKMLDKQDQMLGKQDETIGALTTFHNDTRGRFDVMEHKYGKVSESLELISKGLHELVEILKVFKQKQV